MRLSRFSILAFLFLLLSSANQSAVSQIGSFDYKRYLFGPALTLELYVQALNEATGEVTINGGDPRQPQTPFRWDWGDGTVEYNYFPGNHTYADITKNYLANVIAFYDGEETDTADVLVRFVPPIISSILLDPVVAVYVPDHDISLGQHFYDAPTDLTHFDDSFFGAVSRSTLEYVLSVAATVERDFVNDNMYLFDSKFEQYLLRDLSFGGAYTLWFTDPVAFVAGDGYLRGTIGYSSLFHEMGHNFTLNTPASFYYGGKIDGYANAIYSESMAQILQHAAGYEIVNNYETYGLSDDLAIEIREDVSRTFRLVRDFYDEYLSTGKPFSSWNDDSTPEDETLPTFMTIAYKFCEHAENSGPGYREPLKRMMTLLQGFNPDWANQYDQSNNSTEGETFRATLMVAALSYAFSTDLREEFRDLNFPVSDQIYEELYNSPLPIQLVNITANASEHRVCLEWTTASETNNYGFEAYRKYLGVKSTSGAFARRSADTSWTNVGFVAGHGTTLQPQSYSFIDAPNKAGCYEYRVKQIDLDGKSTYIGTVEVEVGLPKTITLYQNYPNPFNPTSTIGYALPKQSYVTLRVYDMLGRLVQTLVDETQEAGLYEVQVNASGFASGVYFYRLRAGSFVDVKKLVLVR
jgi:hypothetical protein